MQNTSPNAASSAPVHAEGSNASQGKKGVGGMQRRNAKPGTFEEPSRRVEDHMNSFAFAAIHGKGLMGLAKKLRPRCEELMRRQGDRLPKS